MAGDRELTRRMVLTAIGGSVCAGAAGAHQDDEDERSEERDPIDETGVVVRFESCTRVRVRSRHDVERLEVALEWDDRSEWWVIEDPLLPLTIDSSNSPWAEHEPIVHSVSVTAEDQTGTYVTLPDSWEC